MFRRLSLSLIGIALALAACTPSQTAAPTGAITLSDGLGRVVSLASPAQRVVSLAPSNTEILYAIQAGAQVVGRDESSDYPAEAAALPNVGGWSGFSTEAIVALQPDLVLAGGINAPELVAELETLGLSVYFLPNPLTLEEMFANLETVGQLTGHSSDAAVLVDSLQFRVTAVDAILTAVIERPVVYYEIDATDPTKPYTAGTAGATNFISPLIERAGGINVGSQLGSEWPQISLEELLVLNPDIILLGDSIYGETPEKVAARPGWGTLHAVQAGKIFPFNDTIVSRPGPRLVAAFEALAETLHPELFQ